MMNKLEEEALTVWYNFAVELFAAMKNGPVTSDDLEYFEFKMKTLEEHRSPGAVVKFYEQRRS